MFESILIFLGVLSFLVFVHELGHFFAAKACGIYVDQFSVGMPPRLFGIKFGETDYCIGALPIGGYVKMAGQEDAPLSEEERESTYGGVPEHRWFNKKPFWQKFIVLFAGPFMNLAIAVVLYTVVVGMGTEVEEFAVSARIGEVETNSPASIAPLYPFEEGKAFDSYTGEPASVGWKAGDVVLEVDGRKVEKFNDLTVNAVLSQEGDIQYAVIERDTLDGGTERFVSPVTMAKIEEDDEYPRYGVAPFSSVYLSEIMEDMPAGEAGLMADDIVTHMNGVRVGQRLFVKMMEETGEGEEVKLAVLRDGERVEITLNPATTGKVLGVVTRGSEDNEATRFTVAHIEDDVKEETGLQRKDVIVAVNGEPMTQSAMLDYARANPGESMTLSIERPSILFGLLQQAEEKEVVVDISPVRQAGVVLGVYKVAQHYPVSQWLPEGFRRSVKAMSEMKRILGSLVAGEISTKQLGGPVMIGQVASQAAQFGWHALLEVTAFISINLFVMNLLPLPVLDGGQIVVNFIEAVRRKPLNQRFLEYFQFAGIVLLIGLMLYVTKNDVWRWVDGLRP